MRDDRPRVSVLVHTLNEEDNLPFALRSVRPWVDEIVVVDMHSTDRTLDVAREFGASVYLHEPMGFADPARAFGLSKTTGEWVLLLDADELISPALAAVLKAVARDGDVDAVWLPRLNYLFGAQMRATGWGARQDRQLRFFRRDAVDMGSEIHRFIHPRAGTRIRTVPYSHGVALVHFNYTSARHFIEKSNRYTTIEADQAYEEGRRASAFDLVWAPVREFVRLFVRRRGFLDGWRGVHLSILMTFYRFQVVAKLRERQCVGTESEITARYRVIAEAWLNDEDGTPDR